MALGSAIGDLIQSVLDIFAAIVNTILAFVHAIYATVRGVITTAFHTVEGTVGLLWGELLSRMSSINNRPSVICMHFHADSLSVILAPFPPLPLPPFNHTFIDS